MNTNYIQIKSVLVKLLQDQQFLRNLLVAYFEISKVNAFRKGSHIKPKQRKFQVPDHNLSAKCIDDFYSSRVVCCISTLKKDRTGLGKILIPNSFNEVVVLTVESIIQAEVSTQPFLEMITA